MTPASLTQEPQSVSSAVTRSAFFIVLSVNEDAASRAAVRAWCADVGNLVRAVGKRVPAGNLSCVVGFSSDAWDTLFGEPRPAELHPFREFGKGERVAVATPGDILLHIRADETDLCFELATQLMKKLDGAVTTEDEVHGFRNFDMRAMIGFVDGTENPTGNEAVHFTVIGENEDPDFCGGSYVLVQKYLHDMKGWNALPVEAQEHIIGRTKLQDIELDEDVKPSWSHSSLTTLDDADGNEIKILRDNMPFGRPGSGEFGTYFIGYARSPAPIEQMLENMFVGLPPGNYDRLLDFSRAVTGGLFFVPSQPLLEALADHEPGAAATIDTPDASAPDTQTETAAANADGSLAIGSLKGAPRYE
ncbi:MULTISPECIES: Dyp-type peroxidase [Paraburkholderia]|uniref:Iron-dependent peroxidase n=1 Tax=Paraburkholderia tropica TaxID=92647 RepID=A0A1A5XMM2_9BURK|nr:MULTISPECIES: Dyp-type peroxidase [Paraburkholderia]MBB2978349.1 putative iron-dependent peroxidase [Paraburkholderia tropica]MBB2998542.1 putative iron-dependent peroxidase [Paraburkholderia tropica]MBB6318683.1 putative iron-dependent peroxidase [Paraburkholderia tropica]MDE1139656.1 Dyp-type peroxidase [Paraburkholderia tropica]OBR54569.1 peroxidase [Paraburkholderia tropica]